MHTSRIKCSKRISGEYKLRENGKVVERMGLLPRQIYWYVFIAYSHTVR